MENSFKFTPLGGAFKFTSLGASSEQSFIDGRLKIIKIDSNIYFNDKLVGKIVYDLNVFDRDYKSKIVWLHGSDRDMQLIIDAVTEDHIIKLNHNNFINYINNTGNQFNNDYYFILGRLVERNNKLL